MSSVVTMKRCLVITCLIAVSRAEPPVSGYLPPSQGSGFGANFRSPSSPSQPFGVPQSLASSHDFLEARSKQSARNFQSAAFQPSFGAKPLSKFSTPSQTYLPSQRSAPNQEHSGHSIRSGVNSQEYRAPNIRNQPNQKYDVPSQRHGRFDHGNFEHSGFGRNAGSVSVQEPTNYGFEYAVNDEFHGTEFGHTESRHDEKAQGQYQVLLPDGRKQTVEYKADGAGFKPHISYEENASEDALARSGHGSGQSGYDNAQTFGRNHHSKKSGKDDSAGVYH